MITAGLVRSVITHEFTFSITLMVWGSIVVTVTVWARYLASKRLADCVQHLADLDRDREVLRQRELTIRSILENGFPTNTPPELEQQIVRSLGLNTESIHSRIE